MASKFIVQQLIRHRVLVTPEIIMHLEDQTVEECLTELLPQIPNPRPQLFRPDDLTILSSEISHLKNQRDKLLSFVRYVVLADQSLSLRELLSTFLTISPNLESTPLGVIDTHETGNSAILASYNTPSHKWNVNDFVTYFNKRYKALEGMLRNRAELSQVTSIDRLRHKGEREQVAIIGMVTDKQTTKNHNIMLTLEDPTGSVNVLISTDKQDIYEPARDITFDEIIGISGSSGRNIVFANKLVWPDIPVVHEMNKSPLDERAVFLSDIHFGSKKFLRTEFERFITWLKGNIGNEEQQAEARKVRYIFIVGDLVDGVGIYPGQEQDLALTNIYDQYAEAARYLSQIPQHITVYICPGNHDAVRLSEPQPAFHPEYAKPVLHLPHIKTVSNPSMISIGQTPDFSGIKVLLYHGYSFDYYFANVEGIRISGGYDRADLLLKYLLKRRHLAPTHASSLYIPDTENDPLVISQVPDLFASGHIHKSAISTYRGVTLISGSCWQDTTAFQLKLGHSPEPCRVPIINLKTRAAKILRFG